MPHQLQLPPQAPILALPDALLLPFALIPLSITAPHHCALIRHALEHHRMFCIALIKPESTVPESTTPSTAPEQQIYQIGGIGFIRACVILPSGGYNLILHGIARIQITGWVQTTPFGIAHIRPLPNHESQSAEATRLTAQVLKLCHALKDRGTPVPVPIEKQLAAIRDPSALADIVSHTFIPDPFTRQQLLEELSVPTRLRHLITQLEIELLS